MKSDLEEFSFSNDEKLLGREDGTLCERTTALSSLSQDDFVDDVSYQKQSNDQVESLKQDCNWQYIWGEIV